MPYVYKRRFLDTQYGKRKDGDTFKIGDSPVLVDQDGDITIKENEFRGFEGLWDFLTRKNVNKENVTSNEMRKYKKILLLTNAHVGRGKNYCPPFREAQKQGCRIGFTPCMEKILS